jgi:peptidyl-dipeptidase Dcp
MTMPSFNRSIVAASFVMLAVACSSKLETQTSSMENPLEKEWQGPYGGVPAFDKVKTEFFAPALEAAIAENLKEINAVADNPADADFENTIADMERTGKKLARVMSYFNVWSSTMSDSAFQKVEAEFNPKIAAMRDKIIQNSTLFSRIKTVFESQDLKKLSPEQQRLTWFYHSTFARSGAKLDAASKDRLAALNQELAGFFTKFSQNVLADENDVYVTITAKEDLEGLTQSQIDAARSYGDSKAKKDQWAIANTRSAVDPFLTFAVNRNLREKVWRMFKSRGENGGANDNKEILQNILRLRTERAKLLGFKTHAHLMLDDKMALTPERAMELMYEVWKPAVERVQTEVKDMLVIAKKDHVTEIQPWDYLYYAEKVRKQKYDLDENQLTPYMQLENLREGMFWVASELFGFSFAPVDSIPVYHADVKVWEVKDKTSGRTVGLWYFDPFARTGKRSGAWMNNYRNQQKLDGEILPIVSNNCNFVKGKPGEPVLISFTDARTLFHEFGHALHGLSSNVTYPTLQSPNVASDFVEFPSQIMEQWFTTPEVMNQFALHYETGKPVPQELVDRVNRAKTFNSGYETVSYLSSAIVDMKMHLESDKAIDPTVYERETLASLNMPPSMAMRHRLPHFMHIFSDDGYSAGYYSYLWSEVISADAYRAFLEKSGPYDKAVAMRYKEQILSIGNTMDAADAYRKFRGRNALIDGYMEDNGFMKTNIKR